jgi:hypothetical protein
MRACWRKTVVVTAFAAALAVGDGQVVAAEPRAVAVIENDLLADGPAVRVKAALELADRFPDGAVAVPMLVDLLDDESPDVVAAAARAIDSMSVTAAAALADFLADDRRWSADGWLHRIASSACGGYAGEPGWSAVGRPHQSPSIDQLAAASLFPADRYVPRILDAAREGDDDVRAAAATALTMTGVVELDRVREFGRVPSPARSAAAAKAVALLRSDDHLKAWAGAILLERLQCTDDAVVDELVAALARRKPPSSRDSCGDLCLGAFRGACKALGAIGPPASRGAPVLVASLADEVVVLSRADPVGALLRMGTEADVVAALERLPRNRIDICCQLAWHGGAAAAVTPILIDHVRSSKATSLGVAALGDLGPAARDALPVLKARMTDATDGVGPKERIDAAGAVLAIAPDDPDAIKALLSAPPELEDKATRSLAARAAPLPSVVERVVAFFRRQLAERCKDYGIVEALARFGPAARSSADDLIAQLKDAAEDVAVHGRRDSAVCWRRMVVRALGKIGPDAAAAVPALTELRDKGDETIRVAAAQALRRIRAKK